MEPVTYQFGTDLYLYASSEAFVTGTLWWSHLSGRPCRAERQDQLLVVKDSTDYANPLRTHTADPYTPLFGANPAYLLKRRLIRSHLTTTDEPFLATSALTTVLPPLSPQLADFLSGYWDAGPVAVTSTHVVLVNAPTGNWLLQSNSDDFIQSLAYWGHVYGLTTITQVWTAGTARDWFPVARYYGLRWASEDQDDREEEDEEEPEEDPRHLEPA